MVKPYWLGDSDAPFATLLRVVDTYCNPAAHDEAYDELVELASRPTPTDEIATFKHQLRQVLSGDSEGLPPDALSTAAAYREASDEKFLRRLWSDLYPNEPVPTAPAG